MSVSTTKISPEQQELIDGVHAYRRELNMSVDRFSTEGGLTPRALRKFLRGEQVSSRQVEKITTVLKERKLTPFTQGIVYITKVGSEGDIDLTQSDKETTERIRETASRYINLLMAYCKTSAKTKAIEFEVNSIVPMLKALTDNTSKIPVIRQGMILGVVQGLLCRMGAMDYSEMFSDQGDIFN